RLLGKRLISTRLSLLLKSVGWSQEEIASFDGEETGFGGHATAGRRGAKGEEGNGTEGGAAAAQAAPVPRSQDDRRRDDEEPRSPEGHHHLHGVEGTRSKRIHRDRAAPRPRRQEDHLEGWGLQRARGLVGRAEGVVSDPAKMDAPH